MDVEQDLEGWRTTFRLPQLNFASMNTRHAKIRVWSACKEELTSSLCLLDDRFAEELDESEQSAVPVQQRSALDVGKTAQSTSFGSCFARAFGSLEDAKKVLLLHQTTSGLDAMLKGLQFYDEQLRVLTFQKEHHHGNLNAFGAGKGTSVTKGKATKGRRANETKERGKETKEKAKVNELTKANLTNPTPQQLQALPEALGAPLQGVLCSHQGSAKAARQPAHYEGRCWGRVQRRRQNVPLREHTCDAYGCFLH
eukprot:s8070_g1.t1